MQKKFAKASAFFKYENLTLKPLKKMHFKEFVEFSKEYDGKSLELEEFLEMFASKEFLFMQSGKLWLYLFEKDEKDERVEKDKFFQGEIIGYTEISPLETDKSAEIGYFVKASKRNSGYAKKMLNMAMEICKNMQFEFVVAKVDCENISSIKVLQSQNFVLTKENNSETATLDWRCDL